MAIEPQVLPVYVMLIVELMLLAFGAAFIFLGWRAIEQRHFDMEWESVTDLGVGFGISHTSHGVETFNGARGVLIGVSFMSFGVIMITWGVGVVVLLSRQYLPSGRSKHSHMLGWFSFICFLVGMICMFPPWKLSNIPFNVVVALSLVLFFLPDAIRKWGRGIFIGLTVVTIVIAQMNTGAATQIVIGMLASLTVLAHVLILFPHFVYRLNKSPTVMKVGENI